MTSAEALILAWVLLYTIFVPPLIVPWAAASNVLLVGRMERLPSLPEIERRGRIFKEWLLVPLLAYVTGVAGNISAAYAVTEWEEGRLGGPGTIVLLNGAAWVLIVTTIIAMRRRSGDQWNEVDRHGLLYAEVKRVIEQGNVTDSAWLGAAWARLEEFESRLTRRERLDRACRRRLGLDSACGWNWAKAPKLGFLAWQPTAGGRPRIRLRDLLWIMFRTPLLLPAPTLWVLFALMFAFIAHDQQLSLWQWVDNGIRLTVLAAWVMVLNLASARAVFICNARLACERDTSLAQVKAWLMGLPAVREREETSRVTLRIGRYALYVSRST
jgi:hypothetical protein